MGILTLDNFDVKGKTVLLRVDMNCPIHPETSEILGTGRIEEVVETINALDGAKIVVISHQGRVGRDDFVGMEEHAKQLEKFSGTPPELFLAIPIILFSFGIILIIEFLKKASTTK